MHAPRSPIPYRPYAILLGSKVGTNSGQCFTEHPPTIRYMLSAGNDPVRGSQVLAERIGCR